MTSTYNKVTVTQTDIVFLHTTEDDALRRQCRSDWVTVLECDPDYTALLRDVGKAERCDHTDLEMRDLGYTRYTYEDLKNPVHKCARCIKECTLTNCIPF